MTDPGWHRINIAGEYLYMNVKVGVAADMAFQICLDIAVWDGVLCSGSVSDAHPEIPMGVDLYAASGTLTVTANPAQGQTTLSGELKIIGYSALSFSNQYLFSFDPSVGYIDTAPTAVPPVVPENPWGKSGTSSEGVLRIHVDDTSRIGTDIGSKVRQSMFPEPQYHPFTFNVVPCCSTPKQGSGVGEYVIPGSIWFNVFYGIYDIYCARPDGWNRPFGYQNAAGVSSNLAFEDLERLGKADWNWFSNYLYGVPEEVCAQYSGIGDAKVDHAETVTIGSTKWHKVSMSNITVASAYQSDAPGAAQLVENSMMTDEWRRSFGLPQALPDYPVSFIPTTLRTTLFMAYREQVNSNFVHTYSTLIFGGTCHDDDQPVNEQFLAAQVQAAQDTIANHYPGSGFAS